MSAAMFPPDTIDLAGAVPGPFEIHRCYAAPGTTTRAHVVAPTRLALARRDDGETPELVLRRVRRSDAGGPRSYGELAFALDAEYPAIDAALVQARAVTRAATVRPQPVAGGFLRLRDLGGARGDLPPELLAPVPLGERGAAGVPVRLALSAAALERVAAMLTGGVLALPAYAELVYHGIAARLSLVAELDPAALAAALGARNDGAATAPHARAALHAWFTAEVRAGGDVVRLAGDRGGARPDQIADLLVDRLVATLGVAAVAPAPEPDDDLHVRLDALARSGRGRWRWDLATPCLTTRVRALTLHPLDEARRLAPSGGAPVVDTVELAPLPLGPVPVRVSVVLPASATTTVGVDLYAPAAPGLGRAQAIAATIELEPPYPTTPPWSLGFSHREPVRCTATPFVVLAGDKLRGAPRPVSDARDLADLRLAAADFPVAFVPVVAEPALLALADLDVGVTWAHTIAAPPPVALTAGAPACTLAIPRDARAVAVRVVARPRAAAAAPVALALPAAPRHRLGLATFPGYGPQCVEVTWRFAAGERAVTLELAPDADLTEITRERLDPDHPSATVTWFARDPFRPGLRVRRADAAAWAGPFPADVAIALDRDRLPTP